MSWFRKKDEEPIAPPARIELEVEGETISIWRWARVRHALIWYSEDVYREVIRGDLEVVDGAGERLDLDGALEAGARIEIRRHEDPPPPREDDPLRAPGDSLSARLNRPPPSRRREPT